MIGRSLDRYRLVSLLGEGGMGAVYLAQDTTLEREVAIKVLRPGLAANPELVKRFLSEAMTLAKLGHPHIATLFELKQATDAVFMVMELVRGDTLETIRQRYGALPWHQVAEIGRQVLSALDYAHRRGVIHRDIKPSNLMVDEHGSLKVMDFGIARVLGAAKATRTGHVVGTVEYMAPEQITGHGVDGRADLYSLGIVLYELLAGHGPFDATSDYGLMKAHVEAPVQPLAAAVVGLPSWFDAVIVRALAKSPDERFASAAEFRAALDEGLGIVGGRATPESLAVPAGIKATRLAAPTPPPTREARPTPTGGYEAAATPAGGTTGSITGQFQSFPWSWQLGAAAAALVVMLVVPAFWWFGGSSDESESGTTAATAPADSTRPADVVAGGRDPAGDTRRDGPPLLAPDAPRIIDAPVPTKPGTPPAVGTTPAPGTTTPRTPSTPTESDAPSTEPAPSESAARTADAPAGPERPARSAGALRPISYDRIRLIETIEGKSKEIDVRLTLNGDRIDVIDRKTQKRLKQVRYARIDSATYSFSKHPRWKTGIGAAVAVGVFAAPIFFMKSTRHWLTVQAGPEVLFLRLDKSNYRTVIPTLEARSGVKVETADGEESD